MNWRLGVLFLLAGCGAGGGVASAPPAPAPAPATAPAPLPVPSQPPPAPARQIVPLSNGTNTARLTYNFGRSLAWGSDGICHVCWFEQPPGSDGEHGLITFYRRSQDSGEHWDQALPIAEAGYPVVASSGNLVYVAYRGKSGGRPGVFLLVSRDGGASFAAPLQVSSSVALAGPVSLAADGERVQVAWMDSRQGSDRCEVFTCHSEDGARSWSDELQVSPDGGLSWVPSLALSGNFAYLAWVDLRSGYEVEYLRISRDGGRTWEPEQALSGEDSDHWAPSLVADGARLWVVWFDRQEAGLTEVEVNRAADQVLELLGLNYPPPPSRGPQIDFVPGFVTYLEGKTQFLQQNLTLAAQPAFDELLAISQRWQRGWRIQMRVSRDGGLNFDPVRTLSQAGPSLRPIISRDGEHLDLCWFDLRSGSSQVYLRHSADAGQTWDEEEVVTTSGQASLPCIVRHGARRLLIYLEGPVLNLLR